MCGIVAVLDKRGAPVARDTVSSMAASLRHRGPDGEGTFVERNVGLGHTRLSIVDLEGGTQPMRSPDGRWMIVFNGEIYNYKTLRAQLEGKGHRFSTQSDTEVLAAAVGEWGESCLDKLRGMFAFVALDTKTGEVFAARDRMGIKPLFLYEDGRVVMLASEAKALFASGRCLPRLDELSVHDLLMFGHTLPGFSVFESVREIEPGCCLWIKDGRVTMKRYWQMPRPAGPAGKNFDVSAAKQELYERLQESVSNHLTGDVPIACYLSGGIDSNSVAHQLRALQFDVYRSYSMTFAGTKHDESEAIGSAVEDHSIPNTLVPIGPDALSRYSDVIYHLEQPQWWTLDAAFYDLAAAVRADGIKVSLSGQGSDELLAGYDVFRYAQGMRTLAKFPLRLFRKRLLRKMLSTEQCAPDLANFLIGLEHRQTKDLVRRYGLRPSRYVEWNTLFSRGSVLLSDALWTRSQTAADRREAYFADEIKPNVAGLDPLSQSLYLECRTRLPNLILWKEDRMNMAHGVETRPPFLDHEFVSYCASLPADVKLRNGEEKFVLRQAMRGKLRSPHVKRRKKPFFAPITEWVRTRENKEFLRDRLQSKNGNELNVFSAKAVADALDIALDKPASDPQSLRSVQAEWLVMMAMGYQLVSERFMQPTRTSANV